MCPLRPHPPGNCSSLNDSSPTACVALLLGRHLQSIACRDCKTKFEHCGSNHFARNGTLIACRSTFNIRSARANCFMSTSSSIPTQSGMETLSLTAPNSAPNKRNPCSGGSTIFRPRGHTRRCQREMYLTEQLARPLFKKKSAYIGAVSLSISA